MGSRPSLTRVVIWPTRLDASSPMRCTEPLSLSISKACRPAVVNDEWRVVSWWASTDTTWGTPKASRLTASTLPRTRQNTFMADRSSVRGRS